MSRTLMMVSARALSAGDLASGVSAVHQGRPWTVIDQGSRLAIRHCDQPLLEAGASQRQTDWAEVAALFPDREPIPGQFWCTRLTVVRDDLELGLEVARAVAWEIGGDVAMAPT